MQRKTLFSFCLLASLLGGVTAAAGCTSVLGDFEIGVENPAEAGTGEGGATGDGGGSANGQTCTTASQCASNFCVDGVCCESACNGLCESCKLGVPGQCNPIADGTDPDQECKPAPIADAGAAVNEDGGGAGDSGTAVNIPDGGLVADDSKCAGSCNGARACKFPDEKVSCGNKFCNSPSELAGHRCDGKGHCGFAVKACDAFSCENDDCRQNCAEKNDCQSTHFCNQGVCQQKLADGLGCSLSDQCASGFCVTVPGGGGVCCNSACDTGSFGPGASCSTGKCKCFKNCSEADGPCRVFYKDADGDGYGDEDGIVDPLNPDNPTKTAVVGCENKPPPTFVANKLDCDDTPGSGALVRPNQTGWFTSPRAGGGFDYNCSGDDEKELKEYPSGSACRFCYEGARQTCSSSTTCKAAGEQSRLTCQAYSSPILCLPGDLNCGKDGITCGYALKVTNTAGFIAPVGCGVNSSLWRTCGKCTTASGAPTVTSDTKQQRCH